MKINKLQILFITCIILAHILSASYFVFNKNSRDRAAFKGLPLDDTYVHFVYARNFAQYGRFWYNLNDPQTGASSPLYVVLLSFFFKIGYGDYIVYIVKVLGVIFGIGISLLIQYFIRIISKNSFFGFFGALLVAVDPFITNVKVSGMEPFFFVLLVLLTFFFFLKNKIWLTSLFCGLSILARPEGFILFITLIIYYILKQYVNRESIKLFVKRIFVFIIIVVLLISPWIIFSISVTGKPLPNTYYAKRIVPSLSSILMNVKNISIFLSLIPEKIFEFSFFLFKTRLLCQILGVLLLGIIYIIGCLFLYRKIKTYSIAFLLFPLFFFMGEAYTISFPEMYNTTTQIYFIRYIIPGYIFIIIPVMLALFTIYSHIITYFSSIKENKRNLHKIFFLFYRCAKTYIFLNLILVFLYYNYQYAKLYSENCYDIYNVQVFIGNWISKNIPEQNVIGVIDAGAMNYYGHRKTIDLIGLNTFQILNTLQMNNESLNRDIITTYNISYLIIFPSLISYFSFEKLNLTLLKAVNSPYYINDSSNTFNIYKINS